MNAQIMNAPIATLVESAAAIWTAASLALLIVSISLALARPLVLARRRKSEHRDPISFVIPIKSLDEGFVEAQASLLTSDGRDMEIIVTARDDQSPAMLSAKAIYATSKAPVRFLRSTLDCAASPKVDNLIEAIDAARNDLIFMKDSNVALTPGGPDSARDALVPGVGMVCAIPRACGATTFAAAVETQIMNQSHGRLLLAADTLGLGFGVGKIMVFRKSDFARAGGVSAMSRTVGEDSELAHAFEAVGLRTAFMRAPVLQSLGARPWRDVFDRQMRWTAIRASNERLAFALEPISLSICTALSAAIAAPLAGVPGLDAAGAVLALWFTLETTLALAEGWDVSISAPAAMVARDCLMLSVWIRAWFSNRVVWAGHELVVRGPDAEPLAASKKRKTL